MRRGAGPTVGNRPRPSRPRLEAARRRPELAVEEGGRKRRSAARPRGTPRKVCRARARARADPAQIHGLHRRQSSAAIVVGPPSQPLPRRRRRAAVAALSSRPNRARIRAGEGGRRSGAAGLGGHGLHAAEQPGQRGSGHGRLEPGAGPCSADRREAPALLSGAARAGRRRGGRIPLQGREQRERAAARPHSPMPREGAGERQREARGRSRRREGGPGGLVAERDMGG
ncbi:hypothetical protein C2845_PM07G38570 [Panicum miliaceum]|uniref:Uncharacterized protein n=1 Tax=Panicum miliaceum TaxID=4540 RepID=A0A3L6SNA4_PANMI|nr:hypothetical protein C2845_PM07G38570 [Panicum miliaceum]